MSTRNAVERVKMVLVALDATDTAYHPRSRALFDQLRRAAISVEANLEVGLPPETGRRGGDRTTRTAAQPRA